MSDIVEMLRLAANNSAYLRGAEKVCAAAADEIERLRAELAAIQRGHLCVWCGHSIDLTGKTMEEAIDLCRAHDGTCAEHPAAVERDRLRSENSHLHHQTNKLGGDILRLRAEVAALKKDAERYRWLRSSFRVARWDVKYWTGEFWDVMYGDAMDKQIDAALKEGSK